MHLDYKYTKEMIVDIDRDVFVIEQLRYKSLSH